MIEHAQIVPSKLIRALLLFLLHRLQILLLLLLLFLLFLLLFLLLLLLLLFLLFLLLLPVASHIKDNARDARVHGAGTRVARDRGLGAGRAQI